MGDMMAAGDFMNPGMGQGPQGPMGGSNGHDGWHDGTWVWTQ